MVPNLSLEDHIYQVEDMISLTSTNSMPTRELSSPDSHSVRSCDTCCMETEPTEKGMMDVHVVPAAYHRSNSNQVHFSVFDVPPTFYVQCSQMAAYDMCRRPRGLAMIIDIEVYENDVQERRWVVKIKTEV